ncbi:MAG: glycosyltransferase family 39 protein, partial [Verrucomicrobiaceae bacterium]
MNDAKPDCLKTCAPHRTAMRVLVGLTVFRLLYLIPFIAQFDLAGDESYYWEWGRRLDWGYFSKPPMIGWLMGLVGCISNNSEWGIRCAALALGTASLFLLHRFASKLFGPRAALLSLLLCAFTPANALLNLVLTIDAPLVLCWSAALLVFWSAIEQPDKPARWILLSVILGLGHLSKQMMLLFPVLMILHCAFNPSSRALLRRTSFWICIAGSLLFLTPVLWWNAQHGWVTLKHTSHHFETRSDAGLLGHFGTLGEFLGLQALAFSPVTWVLMIAAVFGGLWKWRALGEKERYAVIFSGPGLAVFVLLSIRQNVNVNWPAVYYISATVLAGAWLDRLALDALPWKRLREWARPA